MSRFFRRVATRQPIRIYVEHARLYTSTFTRLRGLALFDEQQPALPQRLHAQTRMGRAPYASGALRYTVANTCT